MREILFRGEKVMYGGWVYGSLAVKTVSLLGLKQYFILNQEPRKDGLLEPLVSWHAVKPETVGQYTGLKDKNGQMIFEGDLVQPVLPPSISQPSFVWPIMPVVFSDGVFGLQDQRGGVTPLNSFAPRVTFEVMGNIHDNPELLKGE